MTFISVIAATESHVGDRRGRRRRDLVLRHVRKHHLETIGQPLPGLIHELLLSSSRAPHDTAAGHFASNCWRVRRNSDCGSSPSKVAKNSRSRAVLRRRREAKFDLARAGGVEQHLQRLMLDAARKRATAHHPRSRLRASAHSQAVLPATAIVPSGPNLSS